MSTSPSKQEAGQWGRHVCYHQSSGIGESLQLDQHKEAEGRTEVIASGGGRT